MEQFVFSYGIILYRFSELASHKQTLCALETDFCYCLSIVNCKLCWESCHLMSIHGQNQLNPIWYYSNPIFKALNIIEHIIYYTKVYPIRSRSYYETIAFYLAQEVCNIYISIVITCNSANNYFLYHGHNTV